ncbi:MAG: hypothetical protein IT484_02405 [Gammaproteobacteria bacterium]|nr:hypothetical protein [Gammaproteobacteria bacterium]
MIITLGIRSLRRTAAVAAIVCSAWMPGQASAAYIGALSFLDPAGTVGPTDTVPIRLRLTLDAGSDPLVLSADGSATPPFGVPLTSYPTFASSSELQNEGINFYQLVSYDSVTNIGLSGSFSCNDTFTAGTCSGGPYSFEFDFDSPDSPFNTGFVDPVLTVLTGDSIDFSFGSFVPNGPVAGGTYHAYGAMLSLGFAGTATFRIQATDGNGNPVFDELYQPVWLPDLRIAQAESDLVLASTPCISNPDPGCAGAFSRTVVPLPGAAWLLGTALGMLGWRQRNRR